MSPEARCTPAIIAGRLRKAEQFLVAAETIAAVLDHDEDPDIDAAYVTLCVHAGIAAADVVCCRRLGAHHRGRDHTGAQRLLKKVDAEAAGHLGRLLAMKTKAGYSARPVSAAERKRAELAAAALVELARRS